MPYKVATKPARLATAMAYFLNISRSKCMSEILKKVSRTYTRYPTEHYTNIESTKMSIHVSEPHKLRFCGKYSGISSRVEK